MTKQVNRKLKNLEGFVQWYNGSEGVIVQTGPLRADGSKPAKNDGKPYEHHIYENVVKTSGIPEAEIKDQKNIFVFDTDEDTLFTGSPPRTKVVNLRRKDSPKESKPKFTGPGFSLDSLSPDHFEIVPNHPEGKAKKFKIFATGAAAGKAKFKVVTGKKIRASNHSLEADADGHIIEIQVTYPGGSADLTVICADLGTKDYLTLWKK